MSDYALCLAWNWEYDADFVALLDAACRSRDLGLLQVTPETLDPVSQLLKDGQMAFRVLLDRASDSDARFLSVVEWAREHGVYRINPYELASRAWDKAAMHAVLRRTLHTPHTLILPPYDQQPDLPALDLKPLGDGFTIKPALRGGGEGVVMGATSLEQVLAARQAYPADPYLLQAHIDPVQLDARPAWFRVIHCAGQVFPCWWDVHTHVYTPINAAEQDHYGLAPLSAVTHTIARLCGLELFSTEIALTSEDRFVVVDYVNDPIDLRLQSKTPQGVPDDIVQAIAQRLADLAASRS